MRLTRALLTVLCVLTLAAPLAAQDKKKRLLVRPGITSLASIQGRNALPWEKRLDLDAEYVERYSLGLDARIFLLTLPVLFSTRGVFGPQDEVQTQTRTPDSSG